MREEPQKEWDDIDAETERIWRRPQQTHEEKAREAWEKLFSSKAKDLRF